MERKPAEWRAQMRPDEREELERAERSRDASAEVLRLTTKRIKDRVIKRMRRKSNLGPRGGSTETEKEPPVGDKMTISAQNISAVLQKRRAFGSLTLTPFEIEERLSTGPDVSAEDAAASTRLENSTSLSRDESSGRLDFID